MANIGDINNLKDKDDNDLGMVPTHYFDAQGNKRSIAEDVAAIYQAINGKAASSHTHSTGDVSGLDNTLNGLGSSIGNINAALEHKASDDHTHSTLVDHESNSGSVALQWSGASISSVTPTGSNTKASTKYLVAIYLDNGIPVFKDVQAGNVTVAKANEADSATNADKVDGYHILVNQTVTARTDAIFFL